MTTNDSAFVTHLFDAGSNLHWDTCCWGHEVYNTSVVRPSADAALLDRPTSRTMSIPGGASGTNLSAIVSAYFQLRRLCGLAHLFQSLGHQLRPKFLVKSRNRAREPSRLDIALAVARWLQASHHLGLV